MKQILAIDDFENPQTQETDIILDELQQYKAMKKELDRRVKTIEKEVRERLENAQCEQYKSDKFTATLLTGTQNRLDTAKVKEYFEEQQIALSEFQKPVEITRLTVSRKKPESQKYKTIDVSGINSDISRPTYEDEE